ncbi:LexA family protein [Streptomyces shenzhenensis]
MPPIRREAEFAKAPARPEAGENTTAPDSRGISERQAQILSFIRTWITRHEYPPIYRAFNHATGGISEAPRLRHQKSKERKQTWS